VVLVVGRRLPVLLEGAVHHRAGEALLNGRRARGRAVAVVLVHGDRDLRVQLGRGQHQVPQVGVLRVAAGAATRLDDHGGVNLLGRLHDGLDLFHVVDVERGQAVVVGGGVVQEQPHRHQRHRKLRNSGSIYGSLYGGRGTASRAGRQGRPVVDADGKGDCEVL